jgi:hypothetical protein
LADMGDLLLFDSRPDHRRIDRRRQRCGGP